MNYYKVFNLTVKSEILLPELIPINEIKKADIQIYFGKPPKNLSGNNVDIQPQYQAKPNEYLLHQKGIGQFYVINGDKVILEAHTSELEIFRVAILGPVLAAILHQKGIFPLHASAIELNGKAIAFAGPSGIGKSTLVAMLVNKGYKLISDDLCAIELNTSGIPNLCGAYPFMKLWEDVLDTSINSNHITEKELLKSHSGIRDNLEKYRLYPDIENQSSNEVFPLERIYMLHSGKSDENIVLENMDNLNSMKKLQRNTYRYSQLKGLGKEQHHFQMCGEVVKNINIRKVRRGKKVPVNELAEALIKDFS